MIGTALGQLKNSKAGDARMIRVEYLKALSDTTLPDILAEIFNRLVLTGTFPYTWAEAEARPLHKNGQLSNKDNYRYIMLTAIFYKVYSITVNNQITPYLDQERQFFQAGFRKKHSFVHHLLTLRTLIEQS